MHIERKALWRAAASSFIIATLMAGCSGAALQTGTASAGKAGSNAATQALAAERAIAARKGDVAIAAAEAAVAGQGENPAYRALLGQAYLTAGRYMSASAAFEDAMTLGDRSPRTIVNLALIHVAAGDAQAARDLLATNMESLSAADYGLAMAMAGDPREAIRVLGAAIHDPGAGAQERQNLAYSYALAGQWQEARVMAEADLGAAEAARRVLGWAQLARPDADRSRVVAMLGVAPRNDDGGQPVALALNAAMPRPAMAAVAVAPDAHASSPANQAEALDNGARSGTPAVAFLQADEIPLAREPEPETPVIRAALAPVRERVAAASVTASVLAEARPAMLKAQPATRPAATRASLAVAPQPSPHGKWVVQLGAFGTVQSAQISWTKIARGYGALAGYTPVSSPTRARGRTLHRVAVGGFDNRGGADALCAQVQARGMACFVRMRAADSAPPSWAVSPVKAPVKLALNR